MSLRTDFVPHPGYISGRTYCSLPWVTPNLTAPLAIDTIYFHPFYIPRPITIVSGRYDVQTGGAGSAMKAGIWADSAISHRPVGAPIMADNTGVATTSSTTGVSPAISGVLQPGFYWGGSKFTGTLPAMYCIQNTLTFFSYLMGIATNGEVAWSFLAFADTYSNNLPTIAEGATFVEDAAGKCPLLFLRT